MINLVVALILSTLLIGNANAQTYIINKDFEDSSFTSGINTLATCCEDGDSQEIVTTPVRAGTKAVGLTADSTVTTTDPRRRAGSPNWVWTNGQLVRAELVKYDVSPATGGAERWYGFSVFIPTGWSDTSTDSNGTVISQWHGASGPDCSTSPALSLRIIPSDLWRVVVVSDPCTSGSSFTKVNINLTAVEKNVWTDWVFFVKWSYLNDGVLKVWQNGALVVNRVNAPNGRNTTETLGHRLSIYHGWWTTQPGVPETFTNYFDEWRVTDETGSFEAVAPGGSLVPVAPTGLNVTP